MIPFRKKSIAMAMSLLAIVALTWGGASFGTRILSDMLLFHGRTKEAWLSKVPVECSEWLNTVAFAPPSTQDSNSPEYVSGNKACSDALAYPGQHHLVKNSKGMSIHYVIYPFLKEELNTVSQDAHHPPLWVHFHGIGGNFLHGARYLPAARRLGFQLVSASYINHGNSDRDGLGAGYGCKEKDDVLAVLESLLNKHPASDIVITASSMGTMALALAEQDLRKMDHRHQILGYALENPITNVREIIATSPPGRRIPQFLVEQGIKQAQEVSGLNFDECTPMRSYPSFGRPTAVQHSEIDDFSPVIMGKDVFAALPDSLPRTLRIYETGGHSAIWNEHPEKFEEDIRNLYLTGLEYKAAAGTAMTGSR